MPKCEADLRWDEQCRGLVVAQIGTSNRTIFWLNGPVGPVFGVWHAQLRMISCSVVLSPFSRSYQLYKVKCLQSNSYKEQRHTPNKTLMPFWSPITKDLLRWRYDFFSLVNTRPIRLFSGLKMLHPRALLLPFSKLHFMPFDGIKLNWSNISTKYFCHCFDNSLARATPSLWASCLVWRCLSIQSIVTNHVFNISWWHCQTWTAAHTSKASDISRCHVLPFNCHQIVAIL